MTHYVEESLKNWLDHPSFRIDNTRSKKHTNEVLEKTEVVIQNGLFEHHKCFGYTSADGYFYYTEYFGNGWHKRKPSKNGWVKILNATAYNVHTGRLEAKRNVEF